MRSLKYFLLAAFLWLQIPALMAGEPFPERRGAVNDFADVIPDAEEARIEALAIEVWEKSGVAMVICTMPTIGADEDYIDYANRLYSAWGIGKKGEDKGLLIFNVTDIRKIRVETGYGVEGFINDGRAGDVIRNHLIPNFRAGNFGQGFLEATQAFAGMIGAEYGVTFTGETIAPRQYRERSRGAAPIGPAIIILAIIIFILINNRHNFGGGGPWHTGSHRDWGGGWGGGFGGGGGGGWSSGGGGGFGGFGGGSSGGGGASGSY